MYSKVFEWRPGYDQNLILKNIRELRKESPTGVAFEATKLGMWFSILKTAITPCPTMGLSFDTAERLKRSCLRKAIFDGGAHCLNGDKFLNYCDRIFNKFTSSDPKNYLIYFEITYSGPPLFRQLKNEWAVVKWAPSPNSTFMRTAIKARQRLLTDHSNDYDLNKNSLSPILVEVNAHKIPQAFDQANDSIDLVRGILNLVANLQMLPRIENLSNSPHAINRVRIGPAHTLHSEDGTLATPLYWYEPFWSHRVQPLRFSNDPKVVRAMVKNEWKRIHFHRLSRHLRHSIIRYCRALDQHDPNLSLLNIWSAIEFTIGSQNSRHDTIVRRLERIYSDRTEARQVLLHLRHLRNDSAHSGTRIDGEDSSYILYHGEQVLNDLISFLLNDGKFLIHAGEIAEFLDLADSNTELDDSRSKLERRAILIKNAKLFGPNRPFYFQLARHG